MKKILFIIALFLLARAPAQAGEGRVYGYVAVSSYTYTAMVSTTDIVGAYAINICNDSTDTIRCGYDISVSTISGSPTLGFAIRKLTCAWRAISNIIYCKSTASNISSACTVEVFK